MPSAKYVGSHDQSSFRSPPPHTGGQIWEKPILSILTEVGKDAGYHTEFATRLV